MTTLAFAAKRALRDALRVAATDGELAALGLDGVHYVFPGGRGKKRHIYFGGVRSTLTDDVTDGQQDTIVRDASTITMYIRIALPNGDDPDDTAVEADGIAEQVGDAIGAWLGAHRDFAGRSTHAALGFVFGDYSQSDTEHVSILAYAVTVTGYLRLTPRMEE
jgi:hypothetical protein